MTNKKILVKKIRHKKDGRVFRIASISNDKQTLNCYSAYGHLIGLPINQIHDFEMLVKINLKNLMRYLCNGKN